MYLTRLLLHPENPEARRDLAAPYELHRTLKRAFPNGEPDANRLLFRIEPAEEARGEGVPVLVQTSTEEPDWSFAEAMGDYALRVDGPKSFDLAFTEGQRLRFRLVANPVRRVRIDGKKNPRRMPLVHPRAKDGVETGYLDWLERQATRCGFEVAMDSVVDAPFRLGRKRKIQHDPEEIESIPKSKLGHFGVRFDGVLRVTDPDVLLDTVRRGIGPAKAFGFGLLSLAPA